MKFFCVFFMMLLMILSLSFILSHGTRDTGFKVDGGKSITIDVWEPCKVVENTIAQDQFVSTRTEEEWSSFITNTPSGISLDECTTCGDGTCDSGETTANCCKDCGTKCGDGVCNCGETKDSCPKDCEIVAYCGDGSCNGGETTANCCIDCGTKCGDGKCNCGETQSTCCKDCGCPSGYTCINNKCERNAYCGDGSCNGGETQSSCPEDCCDNCECCQLSGCSTCDCSCRKAFGECYTGYCAYPSSNDPRKCCSCYVIYDCGDGMCCGYEDRGGTCLADCGYCGDGYCYIDETQASCPEDCGYCGDGICQPEDPDGCEDCMWIT